MKVLGTYLREYIVELIKIQNRANSISKLGSLANEIKNRVDAPVKRQITREYNIAKRFYWCVNGHDFENIFGEHVHHEPTEPGDQLNHHMECVIASAVRRYLKYLDLSDTDILMEYCLNDAKAAASVIQDKIDN